jgi:hypothetical protein
LTSACNLRFRLDRSRDLVRQHSGVSGKILDETDEDLFIDKGIVVTESAVNGLLQGATELR